MDGSPGRRGAVAQFVLPHVLAHEIRAQPRRALAVPARRFRLPRRRFPRKARPLPSLLTHEEAALLVQLLERYSLRPSAQAIHLLLLTGASKAEILGARWEDLDTERGTLATHSTFTGRARLIPLNSAAMRLIESLPRKDGVPWLFSSPSGRQLSSLFYTWDLMRRHIGRPELRLQDLRHSFANFLMHMGVHTHELRNIMGHYMPETMAALRNLPQEKR